LKILVVDDDDFTTRLLQIQLRAMGLKDSGYAGIELSSSGADAIERLAQAPADFGLVFCDLRMPGMDGAELLTNVSQRHPEVARVVLSGHIEPEAAIQVAVAGHRFLTKPSDAESLIAVIEQLLIKTSSAHQREARRIAGGVRAIPTLPEHTAGIVGLLAPDANLAYAVQTAMHDVGLTAKLLQL
jgi:CheY-like chemotaxis protein